ncbi:MAG: hypothetical protein CNCCGFBP_00197 [Fimbriimonadaceae bacterium]|nr:hypothetical protein [Fimbriimonadaceae bacterium]
MRWPPAVVAERGRDVVLSIPDGLQERGPGRTCIMTAQG